jgi:hypothetical protein
MLMHFWSHKLARLLLPWAMLTALVSSFWIPGVLGNVAFYGQVAFYLAAVLDDLVPERMILSRLTAPIKAFTVLSLAAAFAPFALLQPADQVWQQTNVNSVRRTRQ